MSVLLGWLVGLVINRASKDMAMAVAAGMLALAGSALASLIGIVVDLVKNVHVPLSLVLSNVGHVFTLVPRIIGGFGFLCWAVSAVVAGATVRSRGRTLRRIRQPASLGQMSGGMTYRPLAGGSGSDVQVMPGNPPSGGPTAPNTGPPEVR